MKTVEEVVDAILDEQSGYLDYDGVKIAAIIRADREALLKRVEFKFRMGIDINDTAARAAMWDALAAVRKESL
jgi:hypothetical protein